MTSAPTELGPNLSHAVWRVDTDRGRYAVKCLVDVGDVAALEAAVEFERHAVDAGVPAAVPVLTPSGQVLVGVEPAGRSAFVRVHRWVEGWVLGDGPARRAVTVGSAVQAGQILARLHHFGSGPRPAGPGAPAAPAVVPETPSTRELDWLGFRDRVGGGPESLRLLDDDALALLASVQQLRPPPAAAACFCHGDFKPENTVESDDGLAVLDWDQAGWGDPAVELAIAALRWAGVDGASVNEPHFGAFLDAYRRADGPVRRLQPAHFAANARTASEWIDFNARHALGEFPDAQLDVEDNIAATLFAVRGCLAACSSWASMAAESLARG